MLIDVTENVTHHVQHNSMTSFLHMFINVRFYKYYSYTWYNGFDWWHIVCVEITINYRDKFFSYWKMISVDVNASRFVNCMQEDCRALPSISNKFTIKKNPKHGLSWRKHKFAHRIEKLCFPAYARAVTSCEMKAVFNFEFLEFMIYIKTAGSKIPAILLRNLMNTDWFQN